MILDPTKNPLLSYQTIAESPELPVNWDVEGLLVHGDKCVVYGEWGAYKSFLLYHLALHLAEGADWLGWPIPQQRPVLYIDEEMNLSTVKRRMRRMGQAVGSSKDLPLRMMTRTGLHFTETAAPALLRCLKAWNFSPSVIIVEAMRRVMIGDENHASDVALFWSHLTPLLHAGMTVIVSHHMSKPNQEHPQNLRNRQSGSTDILAGVDCAWAITRQGKSNVGDVTQTKQRDGEEADPWSFIVTSTGDPRMGPIQLVRDKTFTEKGVNPWK